MGLTRQPILRSKTMVIAPNSHWVIKGDDARRYIILRVDDDSGGFDVALTKQGEMPLADEWIDGVGKSTAQSPASSFVIDTGVASDIHFRDTDNPGNETISVVSDILPEFIQIA